VVTLGLQCLVWLVATLEAALWKWGGGGGGGGGLGPIIPGGTKGVDHSLRGQLRWLLLGVGGVRRGWLEGVYSVIGLGRW
jgi:hypothetical protein